MEEKVLIDKSVLEQSPAIFCCGVPMRNTQWSPDQDGGVYVGFDCEVCGAALYGAWCGGKDEDEADAG